MEKMFDLGRKNDYWAIEAQLIAIIKIIYSTRYKIV